MATPYFKTEAYKIKHAGWLLACDAPNNIASGQRILVKLSPASAAKALAYKEECLAVYAAGK